MLLEIILSRENKMENKQYKYKIKDIKSMVFDCFYVGTEYMDHFHLNFQELSRFLDECESMFGSKWEPIFLRSFKISDEYLCHIINTLYKHKYVTCLNGEMMRCSIGTLIYNSKGLKPSSHGHNLYGESSLLKHVRESNYKERQKALQVKYLKK